MVNKEYLGDQTGESSRGNLPFLHDKKRGFLMLRVSDRKQAIKYGPDAQRAEAYQGAKESPVPMELSRDREAFWIETASGWNRKQFNNEMTKRLEEFRRGEWDVLVFPRVDRETRFLAGSFEELNQLLKAGVPIYFAKHRLLLRQGDSEAFDSYLEHVRDARAYIKVLKANTGGGRMQAMEAGRIPSGWGPKGLTGYDWKDGRFIKNTVGPAVEFMLRQYLEGYSESAIMFQLKERAFLTKAGRPFAQSTVSKVLHHARWYAGIITWRGREFQGIIEPIITEEEAKRILARLSRNTTWRSAYGRAHWWTGRVGCGLCHRRISISKSHGCRCNGRDYRISDPCDAPCFGFDAFQKTVSDALRLTLSHPQAIFEQICEQMESREREMAFLASELKEKRERLTEIEHRLERLSHQHELGIISDAQLLERSSGVARDAKEMQARVRELEDILSAPAQFSTDIAGGLAKDFQNAFHLSEGTPQARFLSTAAVIAAKWVDDLGMLGTIPHEDTWQRLAEKLNLHMLVYPPEREKIDGQLVKATLRISGEFTPGTNSRVGGASLEAATASTLSL
jgi:DNA invertase Pin-like site-specific DNA recombinase